MQQVRSAVVHLGSAAFGYIHFSRYLARKVCRYFIGKMYNQVVLFFGIGDEYFFSTNQQFTPVAHLATARPDGELQSNPVWFEWDRGQVKISQTRSRQKMRNLDHDPHVAMSVTDPENPYRYVEVRGVVDRVEDDPERRFIDRLSERYMGKTPYPYHQPDDERGPPPAPARPPRPGPGPAR